MAKEVTMASSAPLEHKYIRIPFTSIRLIFEEGRYFGWYRFK